MRRTRGILCRQTRPANGWGATLEPPRAARHSLGAAAPGGDREAGAADQGALGGRCRSLESRDYVVVWRGAERCMLIAVRDML